MSGRSAALGVFGIAFLVGLLGSGALARGLGTVAAPEPASPAVAPVSSHTAQSPAPAAQTTAPAGFDKALLTMYCLGCHNERTKSGGLAFDQIDIADVAKHAATLEKVVLKLRGREMPPPGSRRPDEAGYRSAITSLEASLDRAAAASPNPGRIAVHRLNRTEYTNAVRDLLAVTVDPQSLLGPDETGYGFDNIADVLTISPGLLDRYKLAAWKLSRLAVGDPTIRPVVETYKVPRLIDQEHRVSDELPFGTRGGTVIRHNFPLDGEYVLRIQLQRAYAQNVIKGLAESEQIDVRMDGAQIKLFAIGGECVRSEEARCKAFRPELNVASGVRVLPAEYDLFADKELEVRFPAKAGPATITTAFLEKSAVATEGGGTRRQPLSVSQADNGAGLMAIENVQIEGPFAAAVPKDTPSRDRIFVCHPSQGAAEAACAKQIISTLAKRAYRRPATAEDVSLLTGFYEDGHKKGGFERGIQSAIEALLMSPNFVLRVETAPAKSADGTPYPIADLDLASRLSFFLWSSIPDDALLDAAIAGRLRQGDTLQRQVKRMLADDKASALVDNFFTQWLSLRDLKNVAPDPALFPDFDDNLRDAFLQETRLFVQSQLSDDRGAPELLSANYTFVNERLAEFYGIPHIFGPRFRRVTLTDPNRAGLLGQGSVLTVTSYSTRTSPVVRGKWLLTNILGSPPPPPPPDIPALVENGEGGAPPSSVRDRMAQHRNNPVCASCHRRIDPMGFALENFSAVGRWRTSEYGLPIDASGAFPDGTAFSTPAEFRQGLMKQREEFVRTLTIKLMTYALGRGVEHYDMPAVRSVMKQSAPHDYRWSSLILAIVNSLPFQMNRSPVESPAATVASAR